MVCVQFAPPVDVVLCGAPLVLLVVLAVATSTPTCQNKILVSRATTQMALVAFLCHQTSSDDAEENVVRKLFLLVGAMRSHAEVLPVGQCPRKRKF